jgi:outer membrane protein OmpA-like peptidoglycan-associated protein
MNTRPVFTAAVLILAMAIAGTAAAQSFGDVLKRTVQRAVQGETQRKVDEQARHATRCALGDQRCARAAQQRGDVQATASGDGAAAAGAADHPLVPRYEGARVIRREADEFTDYPLRTGKSRATGTRTLEGALTRLTYEGPRDRSVLEVFRNYEAVLRQIGFETLYSCSRAECGDIRKDIESGERYMLLWGAGDHRYLAAKLPRREGDAYVALYVTRNGGGGPAKGRAMVQLDVIETRPMEDRMVVVDADTLRGDLARDGRSTLYGIQFDFDRDTLQPGSAAQIGEIAALLRQSPALAIRVVGHTDGKGASDYNMALSQRRATRIVDTLAREHGIARGRMDAAGVGAAEPVASNDTEEGRALNRRVEIVERRPGSR